jgi:ribosomal protein S19
LLVGLKLGDFVGTRTFKAHGGVKAKKAMQKK